MKVKTMCIQDTELCQGVIPLYLQAFSDKRAKPINMIKNMFAQGIAEK